MIRKFAVPLFAIISLLLIAVVGMALPQMRGHGGAAEPPRPIGELASNRADSDAASLNAVRDGVVTPEELEAAVTRAASCISERGYSVIPLGDARLEGRITVGWEILAGQDAAHIMQIARDCQDEHSSLVQAAFVAQSPVGRLSRAEWQQRMVSCLRAKTLDVSDNFDNDELTRLSLLPGGHEAIVACHSAAGS